MADVGVAVKDANYKATATYQTQYFHIKIWYLFLA